ncbi:L-2-hydroxyglutarate oxidase [Lacisediminihabitans changchengi]|uniref:L-2-hydroxyglutarate oxidase n=1 Tax=Lacisediminihabitans changchengi TaxID=2787634 RepID=A0A934SUK1_9MICO|nr:L-2-hydroxyglutarate oxidase [Lacisediminihabitans changchengi]MBK4348314.1 L-2-hydroxyglutarate oxidase [Lacisediminihabitans changchengi]
MTVRSATVIGGGIVGLAVAEKLARIGIDTTVLEKEDRWAAHQTGHNSGVIHAGPYYKPGSLKATMCAAGNRSMVAFAQEHGISHDVCGKLIVAATADELPRLEVLHERALANGADARVITADEAREYEPNVATVGALRVENTGIIDYSAVSAMLARLAQEHGARLELGTRARRIAGENGSVTVEHDRGTVTSDILINCAGLQSDTVARLAGVEPEVRIVPFRGEYYELVPERRGLVQGLIYPVPDPDLPFLGVHLTRMIDGSVHAGPNAVLALKREGYRWRDVDAAEAIASIAYPGFLRLASGNVVTGGKEIIRSLSKRVFAASLARLVPAITGADIVRAGAGVRAQAIRRDGSLADDFIIQRTDNQIHVLNAPSPAATSSLEIADYIVRQAGVTA